jgi:acyl carrier protein
MDKVDVLARVTQVFRNVFEDDALQVQESTTSADVAGWDSLMHITLMINVEKSFGVRFTSAQLAGLKNVGELIALLARQLEKKGRSLAA